jgi:hypothetical protein
VEQTTETGGIDSKLVEPPEPQRNPCRSLRRMAKQQSGGSSFSKPSRDIEDGPCVSRRWRRSGRLCRRGCMAAPSEWFVVEVFSPRALRLRSGNRDPLLVYSAMLARLRDLASQFDVVHSHLDWLHIPLEPTHCAICYDPAWAGSIYQTSTATLSAVSQKRYSSRFRMLSAPLPPAGRALSTPLHCYSRYTGPSRLGHGVSDGLRHTSPSPSAAVRYPR